MYVNMIWMDKGQPMMSKVNDLIFNYIMKRLVMGGKWGRGMGMGLELAHCTFNNEVGKHSGKWSSSIVPCIMDWQVVGGIEEQVGDSAFAILPSLMH